MSIHQLYHEVIKQHSRSPIGAGKKMASTHGADGYNPSCGDELNIYLELNADTPEAEIKSVGFNADACAICTASASLLCQHSAGKTVAELLTDIQAFAQSLNQKSPVPIQSLECLSAVVKHPSRINCALLPWQTLRKAMSTPINSNLSNEQR